MKCVGLDVQKLTSFLVQCSNQDATNLCTSLYSTHQGEPRDFWFHTVTKGGKDRFEGHEDEAG